jgi:very-short-patch-repair endonuclease
MPKPKTMRARQLRRKMTDAEKKLWYHLRNRNLNNLKFRRQVPKGSYILDFYCPEKKTVIEVDGSQHYSKKHIQYDKSRTTFLQKNQLFILRYSDKDVLNNIDSVLQDILNHIGDC